MKVKQLLIIYCFIGVHVHVYVNLTLEIKLNLPHTPDGKAHYHLEMLIVEELKKNFQNSGVSILF